MPSSDNTEKRAKIQEEVETRIRQWKQSEGYRQLHHNTQKIVEDSMRRQKHSDFYYKLNELTLRLHMLTETFHARVPNFEKSFKRRQLEK